jgi:hypothetical protein
VQLQQSSYLPQPQVYPWFPPGYLVFPPCTSIMAHMPATNVYLCISSGGSQHHTGSGGILSLVNVAPDVVLDSHGGQEHHVCRLQPRLQPVELLLQQCRPSR